MSEERDGIMGIMKERNDRYGINMKKYCRRHEAAMRAALDKTEHSFTDSGSSAEAGVDICTSELLEYHLEKLRWIQHERLIHLIVTVMVVFVELFAVYLTILHPELGILPPVIMLGLAVLLGFYFYHYFFLENTVQRWYKIADELYSRFFPGTECSCRHDGTCSKRHNV